MRTLYPIFKAECPPTWSHAVWIGEVWHQHSELTEHVALSDSDGYARARIMHRTESGRLLGFHTYDLVDGVVELHNYEVGDSPETEWQSASDASQALSVIVCTYDRPAVLKQCLQALANQTYENFEVLVVDNHPASSLTGPVVASLGDSRFTVLEEPNAGLSRARNVGLVAARNDVVVFTDDDVVVDSKWLERIVDSFALADNGVWCVSGIVLTGEIRTYSQWYFDRRVDWSASMRPEHFSLDSPPKAEPLFPFQVARFGTGANFAVRRARIIELGGFDEGLGAGTRSGSGEDSDIFFRILSSGGSIAYDPSCVVWHRHREDDDDLAVQMEGYGIGYGAWLAKTLLDMRAFLMFLARVPRLALKIRGYATVEGDGSEFEISPELARRERLGILRGPRALLYMRSHGAKSKPLASRSRAFISGQELYRSTPLKHRLLPRARSNG